MFPGELALSQLEESAPVGWRWHLRQAHGVVERWQKIARLTGDPVPWLAAFLRDFRLGPGSTPIIYLEFGRLPEGEWEDEQLRIVHRYLGHCYHTCENCGEPDGRSRADARGQGGYLVLCDRCSVGMSGLPAEAFMLGVGGPREPVFGRGGDTWRPDGDDRDWSPTKDAEDDARDGLSDELDF